MDISVLKEFVCLSTHLNFSEAAYILHMSQPTLSRHIAALEYEIKSQLFIRNSLNGNLSLTYVGEVFLADAKKIISIYNSAMKKIESAQEGYRQGFVVGYRRLYHTKEWDTIFDNFLEEHPDIDIQFISSQDLSELYTLLKNESVDVCISIGINEYNNKQFKRTPFCATSLGCAINVNHMLAKKDVITFIELDEEPILLPAKEYNLSLSELISDLFMENESAPGPVTYCRNIEDAEQIVSMNKGINIIPACYYSPSSDRICYRPIEGTDGLITIDCLIRDNSSNPAAIDFYNYCKEVNKMK